MDVKEYQKKIQTICNINDSQKSGEECQNCILYPFECGDLMLLGQKELEKVIKIIENIEFNKPPFCTHCGFDLKENLTLKYFSDVLFCPNCGIRVFPSIILNKGE